MELIITAAALFGCIAYLIYDSYRNFYVYEYTFDQDQIPEHYRKNLRTGNRKRVSREKYDKHRPNNLDVKLEYYKWKQR